MNGNQLFSDDDDKGSISGGGGGREVQLNINEHYAKAFEYRKEREELEQLKAKYGSDYSDDPNASGSELLLSTDESAASSEDEDGEELTTPTVDAALLRTLARIKKRDPAIYDSNKDVFGEEQDRINNNNIVVATTTTNDGRGSKSKKEQSKPVITIRQAKLESMLHGSSRSASPRPLTHVEEQAELRKETIAAFHKAIPDDEDDFLVPREKTRDELEEEEEEYRTFLEREVGGDLRGLVDLDLDGDGDGDDQGGGLDGSAVQEDDQKREQKKTKKKKKQKSEGNDDGAKRKMTKAEADQEFLMNYILNRGWIDRSARRVPTYDEVTSTRIRRPKATRASSEAGEEEQEDEQKPNDDDDDEGRESDSSFDSLASHFEASYNHRFEEPGATTISTFPRSIHSTVRRADATRREGRERRRARKAEEVERKKEEIRRLKALKMRSAKRKLEIVGRQAGLLLNSKGDDDDEAPLRELDLEGDWDPEQHDRQMAGLFDRNNDDDNDDDDAGLGFDEDGKPVWVDDIDIGDIEEVRSKEEKKQKKDKTKKMKKKKDLGGGGGEGGGVDVAAMDADAPQEEEEEDEETWDGTEEMRARVLKRYMDELDALDFNDMVGDLPTRFKYVPAAPANYSLTPAEILVATDKELNEYVSVKKYAPYRRDQDDKRQRFSTMKTNREKLREFKSKVSERTGVGDSGTDRVERKKRKGKNERMKMKALGSEVQSGDVLDSGSKKRKLESNLDNNNSSNNIAEEGRKKRRRKKAHGD